MLQANKAQKTAAGSKYSQRKWLDGLPPSPTKIEMSWCTPAAVPRLMMRCSIIQLLVNWAPIHQIH